MKTFDVYNQFDVVPVKGKDVYIYDDFNNKYLDLYPLDFDFVIDDNTSDAVHINEIEDYKNIPNYFLQKNPQTLPLLLR